MLNRLPSVFLMDDDVDDRYLFGDALASIHPAIHLTEASDGETGLSKLNAIAAPKPDIIFIDLDMPGISGEEVLAMLRAMERFNKTPIVMCTTAFLDAEIPALVKQGASDMMVKPTSFPAIITNIRKMLEKHCGY